MESLHSLLQVLKIPTKVKENLEIFLLIKHNWGKILAEKTNQVYPCNFDDGTLYLAVKDHYELQNLQSQYLTILNKVNNFLKAQNFSFSVKAIKFLYYPNRQHLKKERFKEDISFKDEAWSTLEKNLSQILDEELRGSFLKLLKNYREALKRLKER